MENQNEPQNQPAAPSGAGPVPPASFQQQGAAWGNRPAEGDTPHQVDGRRASGQQASEQQASWQQGASQPYVAPAPAPVKKSHGWIVAIAIVVALLIISVVSVTSCTRMIGSLGISSSSVVDSVVADANSVGVIEIDGTIDYDNSANSPEGLKYLLDEAADDDNIVAVVLRVNSGGGSATAGEEMATYVREFRENTGKPVVVSSAALNASAAYEISSQADYIYVAKTTEIGAIGTVMQSTDYSELLGKLGVRVDNIASAESKDSSYGTRALTDDERAYYQDIVNQINEVFIQNVAAGRDMEVSEVRSLATGLVFTGQTAIDNGLADAIGTREDAIEYAARMAGCRSYNTCDLSLSRGYDLSSLADILGENYTVDDLKSLLKEQSEHGNEAR